MGVRFLVLAVLAACGGSAVSYAQAHFAMFIPEYGAALRGVMTWDVAICPFQN